MAAENINDLVNSIVSHPMFRDSLNQILSNNENGISLNDDARPQQSSNRQFVSPAEEFSAVFRRGGSTAGPVFQRGRAHGPAARGRNVRNAPYQPRRSSSSPGNSNCTSRGGRAGRNVAPPAASTAARNVSVSTIFRTKEVVLLPSSTENEVLRGRRKSLLMSQGFVRSELELDRNWSEKEVIEFFEDCFKDKLECIPKDSNKARVTVMLGVGRYIQIPCLQEGQPLDAARIGRLFSQKVIWLLPIRDIADIDDQHLITDMLPVTDDRLEIEAAENLLPQLDNNENVERVHEIVPNISREIIQNALRVAVDVDEAVAALTVEPESSTGCSFHPLLSVTSEVVVNFQEQFLKLGEGCTVNVARCNLWRDALVFYKTAMGNLEMLRRKLSVVFDGEDGIDAGALKAEFFTQVFNMAKKELFESADGKGWCLVPKRSGGNLQVFKVFGVIIAHSILQNGPFFKVLAPWVVDILLTENGVSGNISIDQIPVTAATGCLLNFVKSLSSCGTIESINELMDSADGPAFEQIISSSDWDPNESVNVENKNILINLLLYEETVGRRGRKVEAIREGLIVMGFGNYLHVKATQDMFLGSPVGMDNEIMLSLIEWNHPENERIEKVTGWFKTFVQVADQEMLVKLLKFSTGFEDPSTFDNRLISLQFLPDQVLPNASACTFTLLLPLGSQNEDEFVKMLTKALDYESEGFGDF